MKMMKQFITVVIATTILVDRGAQGFDEVGCKYLDCLDGLLQDMSELSDSSSNGEVNKKVEKAKSKASMSRNNLKKRKKLIVSVHRLKQSMRWIDEVKERDEEEELAAVAAKIGDSGSSCAIELLDNFINYLLANELASESFLQELPTKKLQEARTYNRVGSYRFSVARCISGLRSILGELGIKWIGSTCGSSEGEEDLGIRFSKVYYDGPHYGESYLPLTKEDYPLNISTASVIRESQCISVVVEKDCDECDISTKELIDAVGGEPVHVSGNPDSPFWEEFREVVKVQQQRLRRENPLKVLPLPDIWKTSGNTLEKVAELVHDEFPGTHQADLIRQLIREGFNVDRDVLPSLSKTEFLRREVMLSYMHTWAVSKVGPYNFSAKYYVGRARPEEVAWLIAQGILSESFGVPKDIIKDIVRMRLGSQFDFTAYPEGSPTHPSWPAMHSAGSAASLWLSVILDLSDRQICQTRLVDWGVSYARTVAGVHYPGDNIAGLNLGQEILARTLADHLVEKYGSDRGAVQAKISKARFDWNDFMNSDCYRDHM